jgi:serine/threonine-protein kinase
MARVYLARVSGVGGFERHVVLKTVRPERTEDQSYVTMFLDEARLVAHLHHQHIAQVYEVGVADDGTYFLAMEYLHGETARTVLESARARHFRLPLDFALTVVCSAAAGLHHAHERRGSDGLPLGIVHRDVSPSNVIIGHDGSVKLIDFGIAKAEARTTKTQTGFVKGKAGYMAPEQALGYPVDRRSDVFALGVVLYELTTQSRAFRAASEYEAVQRIVRGDVTRPSEMMPDYPPELEDIVMNALETDPDDRFQDADAMRRAIEMTSYHLGLGLGAQTVTRLMSDLIGARPEPWMTPSRGVEVDDATVVDSESAPVLNRRPAVAPAAAMMMEADEAQTGRFVMVEGELPPLGLAQPVPLAPRAPLPPPTPPRLAVGSTPPPSRPPSRPRAPTVPLRVTPPPRPAPMYVEPPTPPVPAMTARGTKSDLSPVPDLRASAYRARIAMTVAISVFAVGLVAMLVAGGEDKAPASSQKTAAPSPKPAAVTPPTPKPGAPRAAEAAKPTPPPPAPPTTNGYMTLRVTTDPDGATVVLDGVRLGKTPFLGTLPVGPREAVLKVRKKGFVPKKITVRLDRDVTWDIHLPHRR